MDKRYNEEVTVASFNELIEFAKWMNEMHGNYPTIVGGWAVYFYVDGLRSIDIDIVFPNRKLKHDVLINFFKAHRYKEEGVFTKSFFKEVKTGKTIEKIYIDACSIEDINYLKENNKIVLPWKLALKYFNQINLEKDTFVHIPKLELLLLYKIKALLDRQYDLRKEGTNPYLESKIWKDKEDIVSLIKVNNFDKELLAKLLGETHFRKYFVFGLEQIKTDAALLRKHNISKEDIEQLALV